MSLEPPESPGIQGELLDDFYAECDEHLHAIRESLVRLEASVDRVQADPNVLGELFRSFHSFKGISAIVGLRPAEAVAHATEDVLRRLTRGNGRLTRKDLELLMSAAQRLEQIVLAFRSERSLPDYEDVVTHLNAAATEPAVTAAGQGATGGSTAFAVENPSISSSPDIAAYLEEARSRGQLLWRFRYQPTHDLDSRGVNLSAVRSRLSGIGEIVQVKPAIQDQGRVTFEFLVIAREIPAAIATWEADGIIPELMDQAGGALGAPGVETDRVLASTTRFEDSPFLAPSHVVRVDLKRLDELMRLTGELGIHRSRFEQHLVESHRKGDEPDLAVLQEINGAFARSLREIREALRRVRLVPVAEIFARMPFVVRDLSRETLKRARLVLEGQQTEIDKYIIERLKDPLLHLVRNAFAHGIEFPEERSAAGKPSEAMIFLGASTLGDSVIVEVRDDGHGIDVPAVVARAASLGLSVPPVIDDAALLEILCSPGFSTREDADRAAGRGVGMSVVFNTVRELGGSLSLKSEKGKGTRFIIRLPVTLVVSETFIVSAAGQTCAVPQNGVAEIVQVFPQEIQRIQRSEVMPYRGGVLPLIRLASIFQRRSEDRPRWTVLVLMSDRGSVGLLVEQVQGQKEVVVRAVRDPLLQVRHVAGATELGDGKPVLILDPASLASGVVRPHAAAGAKSERFNVSPAAAQLSR